MDEALRDYMKERFDEIEKEKFDKKVKSLIELPDWKFCILFTNGYGRYHSQCGAYCDHVFYSDEEIAAAYRAKWPDADPLFD